MSNAFEFDFLCTNNNYKVNKKSKDYKRLKELFPDCDFIFNLKNYPILMNDGKEYPSVLQFLAKGFNEPLGDMIFEDPLDDEVYELVYKLTDGKWEIGIQVINIYDGRAGSIWVDGVILKDGIEWTMDQEPNDDSEADRDDEEGDTALTHAAKEGNIKEVKKLLHEGANIEERNDIGWAALELAVSHGHMEMVELLLDKGADIEAKGSSGRTVLKVAVSNLFTEAVELLLDKGANIEAKDDWGWTALLYAARHGYEEMVELLLDKGANIETTVNTGTPLIVAAAYGQLDSVKTLIEAGANIHTKNNEGKTALMMAEEQGYTEIIKYLKKFAAWRGSKDSSSKKKIVTKKKE